MLIFIFMYNIIFFQFDPTRYLYKSRIYIVHAFILIIEYAVRGRVELVTVEIDAAIIDG